MKSISVFKNGANVISVPCNCVAKVCDSCPRYGICNFRAMIMIKNRQIMKGLIIALLLMLAAGASASGAVPQDRQTRKAIDAAEDSVRFAATVEVMKNMDFVLEADRLVLSRGQNVLVNSMVNFVSVKGDKAVIQVAPFSGPGANGVGGVTVDGSISDLEYRVSKKGNVTLSMYVSGAVASCKVTFSLPKGGTRATVRIDPNYSSDDISLVGEIVPTAMSRVYEGLSL